jgi:hypothetical protein
MNSEELRIYTALTHPTSPEDYRITEDGTKLYVMMNGVLVCFEGEELDKMSATHLYNWYVDQLTEYRLKMWSF